MRVVKADVWSSSSLFFPLRLPDNERKRRREETTIEGCYLDDCNIKNVGDAIPIFLYLSSTQRGGLSDDPATHPRTLVCAGGERMVVLMVRFGKAKWCRSEQ